MSIKRSLTSAPLPLEKTLKMEYTENPEPHERWLRPSQFLSRIYNEILQKYKHKQHFLYRGFVNFKSEDALISVYSQPHANSEHFLFVLVIENENKQDLLTWKHVYNWNGGWFSTHLKLLCLLDP